MTNEAKILLGFGAATVILIIGAALLFGSGSQGNQTNRTDLLVKSNSTQTGPANAKVTVVEFADFECPACAAAAPTMTQLRSDYKDRVNFVFRHFPLPAHTNARIAAEAAEAAGDQGKFWEMDDRLYTDQKVWEALSTPQTTFHQMAADLGLDLNKFDTSLSQYSHTDKINGDKSDGETLGVNATPTFFINGQKQVGVLPLADFKSLIDQALSSK